MPQGFLEGWNGSLFVVFSNHNQAGVVVVIIIVILWCTFDNKYQNWAKIFFPFHLRIGFFWGWVTSHPNFPHPTFPGVHKMFLLFKTFMYVFVLCCKFCKLLCCKFSFKRNQNLKRFWFHWICLLNICEFLLPQENLIWIFAWLIGD